MEDGGRVGTKALARIDLAIHIARLATENAAMQWRFGFQDWTGSALFFRLFVSCDVYNSFQHSSVAFWAFYWEEEERRVRPAGKGQEEE